jgi:hypothetical protein
LLFHGRLRPRVYFSDFVSRCHAPHPIERGERSIVSAFAYICQREATSAIGRLPTCVALPCCVLNHPLRQPRITGKLAMPHVCTGRSTPETPPAQRSPRKGFSRAIVTCACVLVKRVHSGGTSMPLIAIAISAAAIEATIPPIASPLPVALRCLMSK